MLKVIGNEGCINCKNVCKLLDTKNIPYEYEMFENLGTQIQVEFKEKALRKGISTFPMIFEGNSILTVSEALLIKPLSVIKRNGERVFFKKQRIVDAIMAATNETEIKDDSLAEIIAEKIEKEVEELKEVSVEKIQDIVEVELMNSNRKDVAKRYIIYRNNKEKERTAKKETKSSNGLLSEEFLSQYKHVKAPFTELGEFVYYRTYSRWIPEIKRREYWWETVKRAVEYNCSLLPTDRAEAEELYDNIFNLRQFPAGRILWVGGTEAIQKYGLSGFNCALRCMDSIDAFGELFYVLMLGTGCGVRVKKEDVETLPPFRTNIKINHEEYVSKNKKFRNENTSLVCNENTATLIIGDSKEAWSEGLVLLLKILSSHNYKNIEEVNINYNSVRPKGERLNTFGGKASGHESLRIMFTKISKIIAKLEKNKNGLGELKPIDVLDIANIIGENVVSGGVRRTSEVGLFDANDKAILEGKNELYKQIDGNWVENAEISHRRMSNNSILYENKPSREQLHWHVETMRYSGEPGFMNLEQVKKRNPNAKGGNPCMEILLDDAQTCNLSTVNVLAFVEDGRLNEEKLLRAQYLSARIGYRMTCVDLELPNWDKKQKRDRLTGCSLTGWFDMVNATNMSKEEQSDLRKKLRAEAHKAVEDLAAKNNLNKSLLITAIKPEGTLSLLPTVSSGVHYSHSEHYIRRVRISSSDTLVKVCEELGYPVLPEVGQTMENCTTKVIEFPVKSPKGKTKHDVSAIEQLETYKGFMEDYIDHNCSITVTVRDNEWDEVEEWLWNNWDSVVAVSFLALNDASYPLMPFEECSEEEYAQRKSKMKKFNPELLRQFEIEETETDLESDAECASGACGIR